MPLNPEEIVKAGQAAEKAAAVIEKSGGLGKAAEKAAAAVEKSSGLGKASEKAATSAKTYTRDARGRFTSAAKKAAGATASGAVGAEVKNVLDNKSDEPGTRDDSQDASSNAPSSNRPTQNPGANSPAGRIDLPHIDSAESIAGGFDSSSIEEGSTLRGSNSSNSNKAYDGKLSKIISLLQSILSTEKRNVTLMGSGFRDVENAIYATYNAQVNRDQAQGMENTSSGQPGSFLNSLMSNPGKTAMSSLKGLGVAALGAFAAGAAIDVIKNHGRESGSGVPSSHKNDDGVSVYKDEYGKRWAQRMVDDYFDKLSKQDGFLNDLAASKKKAAGDIYLALKSLFDKSSHADQTAIVNQIASLLKLSPSDVQKQIAHENVPAVQAKNAITAGAKDAIVNGSSSAVSALQKGVGLVAGGALNDAGVVANFFGYYGAGKKLQQKGNDITDMEMHSADQFKKNIQDKNKKNTSMESQLSSVQNPELYRGGYIGTDMASTLLGTGGMGFIGRLGLVGATGGLDAFTGMGNSQLGAYDQQSDGGSSSGNSKHAKLTPEAANRAKKAIAFFQSKGWSREQAEGIVGNLLVESSYTLDPHQKQIGGGGGYGIAQWTSKDRKEQFKKTEGVPLEQSTFDQQLDFVNWEFNHTEKNAGDSLRQTNTVADASKVVTRDYERPKDAEKQASFRADYAVGMVKDFDPDVLRPKPEVASTGTGAAPISVSQGGTSISHNTTIQVASAAAPTHLLDNVTPSG